MHADQEGTERQKEKQMKGMPHVCWFLGRVFVNQYGVLMCRMSPFMECQKQGFDLLVTPLFGALSYALLRNIPKMD